MKAKRFTQYGLILVLALSFALSRILSSHSFYSDVEVVGGNTFRMAGIEESTQSARIVINEVYSAGSSGNEEWVELYNGTDTEVDLAGWKISDDKGNDSLTGTVPAYEYAVIITKASTVAGIKDTAVVVRLNNNTIGSGLNNDGDLVKLLNEVSETIDEMSYGKNFDVFSNPPSAPLVGESLIRSPNGIDTDTANDWIISSSPSPGRANL